MAEPTTDTRTPRILKPFVSLGFREYRLLWATQVGVSSAMWTEQIARNWLTYQMTGSALQLGLVNLMRGVPIMAIGLWGGVLSDRFDKRRLLLVIHAWSVVVYAVMGVVILSGHLALWHLYVSTFALAIGPAMDAPLRTSTIPSVVPPEHLLNALTLNGIAINGTRLLLPAAVGVMLGITSPGWAYLTLAVIYLLNEWVVIRLRLPPVPKRTGRGSMLGDLQAGIAFVRGKGMVLALMISAIGVQGIGFSHRALIPVFAAEKLGMGSGTYGFLMSADGLGAVIGGLLLASIGIRRHTGLFMLAFMAINGAAIIALGWAPWLVLATVAVMLIGGSSTAVRATNNTLLLTNTPEELRGRVMAFKTFNEGISAIGMVLMGALADATDVTLALSVVGTTALLLLAASVLRKPQLASL